MSIDLYRKINYMQDFMDANEIAKSIEIPVEIVKAVIDGRVTEEQLADYDPERTELRFVETGKASRDDEVKKQVLYIKEDLDDIKKKVTVKRSKVGWLAKIYNILWDIFIVIVLACTLSITVYIAYYYGMETGSFSHPLLTESARIIESIYDACYNFIKSN